MARVMSMMVVFLLALVLRTTPVKAVDCLSVISSLFPCTNFLGNPNPILPGTQCCDAATNVVSNGDDVDTLCRCLRQNPLSSGFLPSKAQQLPNRCNLSSFLPLVNCLVPSLDVPVPLLPPLVLPPLIPLPPLVPLPPLIPFPRWHEP